MSLERIDRQTLLEAAFGGLIQRHNEQLQAMGEVMALALDPCPKCWGQVIAGDTQAVCTHCGWSYQPARSPDPIASRRATL